MIVTCPGCSSKYRVRNESVPADGARMRCPKCETLFLAKPPVDGSTTTDDPSSLYQQLAPQGARGTTGSFAPVPAQPLAAPPPTPGVGAPRPGPVTALFHAVDAEQLPPPAPLTQALPAPPPSSPHTPAPSGLAIVEQPRVRAVSPAAPAPRDSALSPPIPARAGRGAQGGIGSWVALAAGALVFIGGSLTWAWTTEALPLDGALMPLARAVASAERPGTAAPDVDQLRRAAAEATERRDLPAAIVAWRRVKAASDDADRRPSEALAKMLVALGEVP